MKHHPIYQPSAFPAWAQCPHWDRKEAAENDPTISEGLQQHRLLAASFSPDADDIIGYEPAKMQLNLEDDNAVSDVDKNTLFVVRRANKLLVEKIYSIYPNGTFEFFPEMECEDTRMDFRQSSACDDKLFGTADLIVLPEVGDSFMVADYKSHYTDKPYWEQLAFYAYCFSQSRFVTFPVDCVHLVVCYGDTGTIEEKTMPIYQIYDMISSVLNNRDAKEDLPRKASTWCSLCSHCGSCKHAISLIEKSDALIKMPEQDDDGDIVDPSTIPALLAICSSVEKRIKAFREWVLQYAKANGGTVLNPDGTVAYEVQTTQRTEIDINQFYKATKDILSPNAIIAAAKLPKTKAKELLKSSSNLKTKEIDAILKEVATEPTTIEKLVRYTKGN